MADIILDRTTHIEFPDDSDIKTFDLHIESGSLLLDEILCEGNIRFGETNATRFEATVYNLDDVSGKKIKVYQEDHNGNRRDLFVGYVDSCKQDRYKHYRKLVAYDALYSIGNANVAGWWYQFWEAAKVRMSRFRAGTDTVVEVPLYELRNSLCHYVGIPYDTNVTLPNDNFMCRDTGNLSSVSFNTILSWICEIQCTVPHIDRSGTLRFILLSSRPSIDISEEYEFSSSEFEGFQTAAIDAVDLYNDNNEQVATTYAVGSTPTNLYTIKNNGLLFHITKDDQIGAEFVNNYLAQISQISYTPCDINMIVSNLDISVGDYIKIKTEGVASIVLKNTLSGSLLVEQEIQASGNKYLSGSDSTNTAEYLSLKSRTDKLRDEIITDDLLNYAYMNSRPYDIENVITPIIELSISMPHTSNLVFLATVNLESFSTETREVQEVVKLGDTEYTMTRTEKMPVIVESFFEWNGAQILSNMPTETYSEDGKHLLNLMFFTIGGRQVGGDVKFKVFLRVTNGHIYIGQNQVNATIISKGSSAGSLPWDGTITLEEIIHPITAGTFTPTIGGLNEIIESGTQTPTPSTGDDVIGAITPEFGNIDIGGIDDAMETSIN